MLHGVVDEIGEELRQLIGIAAHRRQAVGRDVQRHARLMRLHLERGDRAGYERRHLDTFTRELWPSSLELRDLEQSLHHPDEPARFALDDLRRRRRRVARGLAVGDRLRESLDRCEQCTQRVAERGAGTRHDDDRGVEAGGGWTEGLLHEEPLVAAVDELPERSLRRRRQRLIRERVLAIDEHPPVVRDDEQPRVGRCGLVLERVDHLSWLLAVPQSGLHRREQRRGELLQPETQHVVLVANDKSGDRDGRDEQSDRDDTEVGEEQPAGDAAEHQVAGATILYPTPHTVSIFASAPASLSRSCFTWTSTVRVSPGYAKPHTSSSRRSRVSTMPGCRQNASRSSNSFARSATARSPTSTSCRAGSTLRLPTRRTRPPPGMPEARRRIARTRETSSRGLNGFAR